MIAKHRQRQLKTGRMSRHFTTISFPLTISAITVNHLQQQKRYRPPNQCFFFSCLEMHKTWTMACSYYLATIVHNSSNLWENSSARHIVKVLSNKCTEASAHTILQSLVQCNISAMKTCFCVKESEGGDETLLFSALFTSSQKACLGLTLYYRIRNNSPPVGWTFQLAAEWVCKCGSPMCCSPLELEL